jgi:hypothetical protein
VVRKWYARRLVIWARRFHFVDEQVIWLYRASTVSIWPCVSSFLVILVIYRALLMIANVEIKAIEEGILNKADVVI